VARRAPTPIARFLAPAAFLLGVTVAVVLIHSALGGGGGGTHTPTLGPVTHASPPRRPAPPRTTATTAVAAAEYTTVQSGDTFGSIAARSGASVAELETLNPGVSSNALQVGQRIRVK